MRALRLLVMALVGMALVVPAVLVAAVLLVDVDRFRGTLEQRASAALDRRVTIAGGLSIGWSLVPEIHARDVSIANLPGGSRPEMLKLERVELRMELLPLIRRRVVIDRAEFIGADLLLERLSTGAANWEFGDRAGAAGDSRSPSDGGEAGIDTDVRSGAIRSSIVRFRGEAAAPAQELAISNLEIDRVAPDRTRLYGTVEVQGHVVQLEGETGTIRMLLAGQAFPMRIDARLLGAELALEGAIAEPKAFRGVDVAFRAKGDDLARLRPIAGAALPAGAFEVAGHVRGDRARLEFRDIRATTPLGSGTGTAAVVLDGARPRLEAELALENVDLRSLGEAAAHAGGGRDGVRGGGDGRVIPDIRFDPRPLGALDAVLSLTARTLQVDRHELQDIALRATLEGSRLTVGDAGFSLRGSRFGGAGSLDATAAPRAQLRLRSDSLDVDSLLALFGQGGLIEARGKLAVDLRGGGSGLRELLAGLDGDAKLIIGEGRVRAAVLDRLAGGIRELGSVLLGEGTGSLVPLRCAVARLAFAAGTGNVELAVLDTDVSSLSVRGTIDLAREHYDLVLVPRPKSVTLNVVLPVTVTGSFAAPRIGLDTMGALRRLGGIVGAFVFPPAAILAVADLGSEAESCARGVAAGGVPILDDAARGARDAIEGVGRGLRDLFGR